MAEESQGKPLHPDIVMRGDLPPEVERDGIILPWMVSERALQAMIDYDVRDDDVWITTYPKAGTHWAVEIVNLVLNDGNEDKIDRNRQPIPMEFDITQPGSNVPEDLPPEKRALFYERANTFPSPRVFMTHLPEHMMPKRIYEGKGKVRTRNDLYTFIQARKEGNVPLFSGAPHNGTERMLSDDTSIPLQGKVVFVLRNPKDLAISYWHFVRPFKWNPRHEKWDTFFDIYCTDDIPYSSWFTYNLTFWNKHRNDENFLFLKYEDMKRDLRGAVVQVADFLGKPLSDEAIEQVVNKTTVDSMKQRFSTVDDKPGQKTKLGALSIIRKGIVGDWKTQFTVAQNEAFDKLYREKMEGSDLHMEFEIKN